MHARWPLLAWTVFLLGIGVGLGVTAERLGWFSPSDASSWPKHIRAVSIAAPYGAWLLEVGPDGSAYLFRGTELHTVEPVGFHPFGTARSVSPPPHSILSLPKGTFEFEALNQELIRHWKSESARDHWDYRDYPAMESEVYFTLDREWVQRPPGNSHGFLPPGVAQRFIETVREKAIAQGDWPKEWDQVWPYPPIPWGFHESKNVPAVPRGLRIEGPVTVQQFWTFAVTGSDVPPVTTWEQLVETAPLALPLENFSNWGVVSDEASWKNVWQLARNDQPLPAVDFRTHFVLILAERHLSQIRPRKMRLIDGNLNTRGVSRTAIPNDAFAWLAGTMPREGVQAVNGVALVKP
jgi:hypothetical protein